MDKPKCPKTNLRNLKHINPNPNPNPKDSDQREIKSSEAEKDSDQRERKSWLVRPGLALPGSRAAWVCLGRTRWSKADLKPPTSISISLSVSVFFSLLSSLMFWCSSLIFFFFIYLFIYKG